MKIAFFLLIAFLLGSVAHAEISCECAPTACAPCQIEKNVIFYAEKCGVEQTRVKSCKRSICEPVPDQSQCLIEYQLSQKAKATTTPRAPASQDPWDEEPDDDADWNAGAAAGGASAAVPGAARGAAAPGGSASTEAPPAAKPIRAPKDPEYVCGAPQGRFNECSFTCEGSAKGEKTCRPDKSKVSCVRRICRANGAWAEATRLPISEGDRCKSAVDVTIGACGTYW